MIAQMLAVVMAEPPDPSVVGPGRLAFAVVAVIAVATVGLFLSMQRHLRKVPPTFAKPSDPPKEDETTDQS